MGCRCFDIRRAAVELGHCIAGSARVTSAQTNANAEQGRLPTVANAVFAGAFSVNGSAIASAIEALIIPVNSNISTAQSDFSSAQSRISALKTQWDIQDRAWHAAQAAAAAAAAALGN